MSYENEFVTCSIENKNFHIYVKKNLPANDEEFNGLMNHIDNFYQACIKSNTRVGMILDAKNLGLLDTKYYQTFADYFSSRKEMCEKCIIASCIICDNSLISTLVNAFLILYKSVRPVRIETTLEAGLQFIEKNKN